ncbi:hypothetical protein [Peribacillus acanthi]|uniref:hypothetical protein n=1 Tax=Peribacillus acanthi TaxID=2171554 RepID=UPI000D3E6827|nr:hypothetical protein [Peribacillus acanthi]
MKKLLWIIPLILLIIIGCKSDTSVKPDSPLHTTMLMKMAINNKDYSQFVSLYTTGRKNKESQDTFKKLTDLKSAITDYSNYELITLDNGEMVLVHLTHGQKGKVEIQDVILLPTDLKEFFKQNTK